MTFNDTHVEEATSAEIKEKMKNGYVYIYTKVSK